MRASYTFPVKCSLYAKDCRLHEEAAKILANSIKVVLGTQILTGQQPIGFAGMFTLRRPDDTFVRVGPGDNADIEAEVVIL
jgi:hypothetical protein